MYFSIILFWLSSLYCFSATPEISSQGQGLDHSSWNELLQEYVSEDGYVNYAGFMERQADLEAYLQYLGDHVPGQEQSRSEKLAFYINLYNAATVRLILENYPLKSIKDIRSPWGKKRIRVGKDSISLNNIEHRILRGMNEPRIHFAINCASVSCPKLLNRAFTAESMELQLQQAAVDFINDAGRNRLSGDQLQLSALFKWYRADFMQKRSLIAFLQPYSKIGLKEQSRISYLPYNWSLNEK